jgi:hypothetical protein
VEEFKVADGGVGSEDHGDPGKGRTKVGGIIPIQFLNLELRVNHLTMMMG